MGLHANVGITFDLNAVRKSRLREPGYFKAVVANLDSTLSEDSSAVESIADMRIFVDGKLRYSRLQFSRSDGDAEIHVVLSKEDRFLTIVTSGNASDPAFAHVVLIDPVLEYEPLDPILEHEPAPPVPQPDQA